MNNSLINARDIFEDDNLQIENCVQNYILVQGLKSAHKALFEATLRPIKIIMLYGSPGSGKTALLSRFAAEYKEQDNKKLLTYLTPTFANLQEIIKIHNLYAQQKLDNDASLFDLVNSFRANFEKDFFLVLLDEAQMYSEKEMELIRLLSDTRVFKFVITLHKISNEDQLAQSHFQTRIWENVFLRPLTKDELKFFVEQKLIAHKLDSIVSAIDDKFYPKINKWTNGNIRESLKFFYKFFDFCIYLESSNPALLNRKKFSMKILEMLAIHLGYIKIK